MNINNDITSNKNNKKYQLRRCSGRYWEKGGFCNFELGYFHQWGFSYEDCGENGMVNYSIAIVELPNGKIVIPMPEDIQFIDKIEEF